MKGLPVLCLLDTGASITLIDSKLWRESPELSKLPLITQHNGLDARTVKGVSLKILGKLDVPFSLGDGNFPFQPYVVDNFVHDVLIGRDFLQYFNSKIDFQHETLELKAQPFNLSGLIANDTTQPEYIDEGVNDSPMGYAKCDVSCLSNNDCDTEQSSSDNDDDTYVIATTAGDHVYPSQNTEGVPKVHVQDNDDCDALLDSQLVTDGSMDERSKLPHLPNADLEITEEVIPTDSPPPNVDLDNTQEVIPTDSPPPSRLDLQSDKNENNFHHNSLLKFISHFTTINNRALSFILRLNEIQEMVNQVARLRQRDLVGYSHLPRFLEQQLSTILAEDLSMSLSSKILNDGFPLLVNPMVDIEHSSEKLELSILLTIPQLTSNKALCTVEYLSPVKYNISGTCYTGPILTDNLILITCPDTKAIVKADSLVKCHQQDNSLLCPSHILRPVHDLTWLGLPWSAESHMTFPRHHQPADDCSHLIPLLHLGGRTFLSTTSGHLQLNTGPMELSPLAIYQFPCNVTFQGMQTGISKCPRRLEVLVPLVQPGSIKYIPWKAAAHLTHLKLNYEGIHIPAPLELNKTTLKQLDHTYHMLDGQLSQQLRKVRENKKNIHDAKVTTTAEVCAYLGLTIATLNSIVFFVMLCRCCHQFRYKLIPVPEPPEAPQPPMEVIVVNGTTDNCIACSKTIQPPRE